VKGGEHLLHASMPEYPRRAVEQRVEGEVTLDLTLNDRGEVSDARVLSGPEELRKPALESALGWHYSPSELRSTSTIATLRFQVPPANAEFNGRSYETVVRNGEQDEKKERSPAQRRERLLMELERALADPNITDEQKVEYTSKQVAVKLELAAVRAERGAKVEGSSRLVQIKTERLPQETVAEILAHAGVRIGDEMTEDVARRIRAAVRQVDEHVSVSFGGDGKGGTVVAIIAP
jgi:TonB family protein